MIAALHSFLPNPEMGSKAFKKFELRARPVTGVSGRLHPCRDRHPARNERFSDLASNAPPFELLDEQFRWLQRLSL
jgi:hypothetical protein